MKSAMEPEAPLVTRRPQAFQAGDVAAIEGLVCFDCHNALTESDASRAITFPHGRHLEQGAHCPVCHQGQDWQGPHGAVQAETCFACHADRLKAGACASCHLRPRDIQPASHRGDWPRTHGRGGLNSGEFSYTGREGFQELPPSHRVAIPSGRGACRPCHDQEECAACHGLSLPHPAGFVGPAHRTEARQHPEQCARCHPQRECDDCHRRSKPASHTRAWRTAHGRQGDAGLRDCARCHPQSECDGCHRRSKPASHTRAWRTTHGRGDAAEWLDCALCHRPQDCRDCHGLAMPHPDGWMLRGHGREASFEEKSRCWKCHERAWCGRCHVEGARG